MVLKCHQKLSRLYWLYSSLMNIDKILEDFEKTYIKISDFKEIQEESLIKQKIKEDMPERICKRCWKRQ